MSISPNITFNGITKTRAEWAHEIDMHPDTLAARLRKGWPLHEALTIKSLRSQKPIKSYPEYHSWRSMHARCTQPNHHAYSRYGNVGISVCPRWKSFHAFYDDMGSRPFPNATLERINNNKGYSICNCYWAPREVQNRNKHGVKLTLHLAQEIRRLYTEGETQNHIANKFNISRPNVSLIVNNKIWV